MARRRLLSIEAWNRILAPPAEERDMVRHYTLGHDDLALVLSLIHISEPTRPY